MLVCQKILIACKTYFLHIYILILFAYLLKWHSMYDARDVNNLSICSVNIGELFDQMFEHWIFWENTDKQQKVNNSHTDSKSNPIPSWLSDAVLFPKFKFLYIFQI